MPIVPSSNSNSSPAIAFIQAIDPAMPVAYSSTVPMLQTFNVLVVLFNLLLMLLISSGLMLIMLVVSE